MPWKRRNVYINDYEVKMPQGDQISKSTLPVNALAQRVKRNSPVVPVYFMLFTTPWLLSAKGVVTIKK